MEIRFADPVSSIKLTKNCVVIGTMMGRVFLYSFAHEKIYTLCELNSENISDIAYNEKENNIYVGIGDEEIKVFNYDTLTNDKPDEPINTISVYNSDIEHTNNCENAFVLLSPESLFRVQLVQIDEGTLKIVKTETEYELKFFDENRNINNENIKKTLPVTNYSVPFDFDGHRFLWVEFLSSTNRNICVSEIPLKEEQKIFKKDLDKTIGHICQAKLIPNNRIFIVHSLNKCEIRGMDENFSILAKFEHIGEEVLGVDIVYNFESNKNFNINNEEIVFHKNRNIPPEINNEINTNVRLENKKHKEEEINTNRILETSGNHKNKMKNQEENGNDEYLYIKQNVRKENNIEIKDICITTLDIDGNVNLFKNLKEETLFNLYNINNISQDQKDKHFFSMGYAYYIKTNLNYFCISSDHGCYVIKANNKS